MYPVTLTKKKLFFFCHLGCIFAKATEPYRLQVSYTLVTITTMHRFGCTFHLLLMRIVFCEKFIPIDLP